MKTCPKCERQYEDTDETCVDDGAVLVKSGVKNNPQLPGVRTVESDARTAMFTLEEFQKEKERMESGEDPLLSDDNAETASTISPMHRGGVPDRDATRALSMEQLEQMKAERDAQKNGVVAPPLAAGTIPEGAREPETQQTAAIRRKKKKEEAKAKNAEDAERNRKILIIGGAIAGAVLLVSVVAGIYVGFLKKVNLEVVTVPPGAMVLVDNVEVGIGPLKTSVKQGAHSVRARLDGYGEFADVVDVPSSGRSFVATLKKEGSGRATPGGGDPISQKADELLADAKEMAERGDFEGAESKLRAMAALVPDDNRAPEMLAEMTQRKTPAKAAPRPNTASTREDRLPDDDANVGKMKPAARAKIAQRFLDDARTAYDLGEMGRARELLSKCVRYDPSKVQCHRILARVYTKEDNNEKVKYHLQRYLELGGNDDDFKVRDWLRAH